VLRGDAVLVSGSALEREPLAAATFDAERNLTKSVAARQIDPCGQSKFRRVSDAVDTGSAQRRCTVKMRTGRRKISMGGRT
jgi:hypothetical protein